MKLIYLYLLYEDKTCTSDNGMWWWDEMRTLLNCQNLIAWEIIPILIRGHCLKLKTKNYTNTNINTIKIYLTVIIYDIKTSSPTKYSQIRASSPTEYSHTWRMAEVVQYYKVKSRYTGQRLLAKLQKNWFEVKGTYYLFSFKQFDFINMFVIKHCYRIRVI